MCNFFSCVSDGKGNVKFFSPEDIVRLMASGNPQNYDFNSHTSFMHSLNIKGEKEDKWTKWEYNPETKKLELDSDGKGGDRKVVQKYLDEWWAGKDVGYLRNLYNRNSGDRNSGHGNSGDRNSGDWNSGHRNSGHRNSGDGNSGDGNSGDGNSGDGNSGHRNSGHRNSGDGNSGDGNSGDGNSGHRNSGHRNSGDGNSGDGNSGDGNSGHRNSGHRNSGDGNSGHGNSGDGNFNSFCTRKHWMLFDEPCGKEEYEKIFGLDWSWFYINKWVNESEMADDEKTRFPYYKTTGGYLKALEYKEAFKACPSSFIDQVKKLKNFDAKKFEEISGLKV